ncbi:MAG TPA: AI-2E family transporter [Patescibacteria group bacterium]|nr:AI-2E family transporter [Patescibacteria group bacterium]
MPTKVEISHRTIIFTLVLLASVWVVFQIRDVLFLLFISFILMSALRPLVDGMERMRIPRVVSILILYGVVFGGLGVGVASMIPTLASQSAKLFTQLPDFLSRLFPYISQDLQALLQQIAPVGENLVRVTLGVFSNMLAVITVMTFTFYFLLERRHLRDFLVALLGSATGERSFVVLLQIEKRLGAWVLGQLSLMLFIGLLVYGGLFFLRVEYALPLAILAGLLEIVPTIGPTISAVPAVLVAFSNSPSPWLALSVIALYVIVQQIENNLLVPLIMKRSVGLPPILTIVALMIGGRLGGITGAVLAVPILLAIQEIISSYPTASSTKK